MQTLRNHKPVIKLTLVTLALWIGIRLGQAAMPDEPEMERLVRSRISGSIPKLIWKAEPPQESNPSFFKVLSPSKVDEAFIERVANKFGVKGRIEPLPVDIPEAPGFWIKHVNPTNSARYRCVFYSLATGLFRYDADDNGYRFDPTSKTHGIQGVPTKEEAKDKVLQLLPLLRLSTNDLAHHPNGRIQWSSSTRTLGYTDKQTRRQTNIVMALSVTFYQRMPGSAKPLGIGDGGALRVTFVSEGKVASIEWLFRDIEPSGQALAKTTNQILKNIRDGRAFTWTQTLPSSITITNCSLVYPQGNSSLYQSQLWPFYMLTAAASNGREIEIYLPLDPK